jgi:hypothetical protein
MSSAHSGAVRILATTALRASAFSLCNSRVRYGTDPGTRSRNKTPREQTTDDIMIKTREWGVMCTAFCFARIPSETHAYGFTTDVSHHESMTTYRTRPAHVFLPNNVRSVPSPRHERASGDNKGSLGNGSLRIHTSTLCWWQRAAQQRQISLNNRHVASCGRWHSASPITVSRVNGGHGSLGTLVGRVSMDSKGDWKSTCAGLNCPLTPGRVSASRLSAAKSYSPRLSACACRIARSVFSLCGQQHTRCTTHPSMLRAAPRPGAMTSRTCKQPGGDRKVQPLAAPVVLAYRSGRWQLFGDC